MPQAFAPLLIALGTAGIPGLTTAAGGLTAFGSLLSSGLALGAGIAAQLLLGGGPPAPKPSDVKGVIRESVSPRWKIYGRARRGGALAYINTIEGDLYQVVMFGQGPASNLATYYIDDREVEIDGGGWVTTEPYDGDTLRIIKRNGGAAGNAHLAVLTAADPAWTTNHTLDGIACALVVQTAVSQEDFSNVYPQRIAVLNIVADWGTVWDPRTLSGGFSANLALCLRAFLTDDDGGRVPLALVDDASFGAAADVCDEILQDRYGDNVRRYHGAVAYNFEEEPITVARRFLDAMDGRLYLTDEGKIGLIAGEWIPPTLVLSDTENGGILDYDLTDGAGSFITTNEIAPKYTQVEAGYAEATAQPWRNEDSIAEIGVKSSSPEMYAVQNHNHIRRLAKLIAARSSPRWTGSIRTTLAGLEVKDQSKHRFITLQISDLGVDEDFEVQGWKFDPATMTVQLDVQSFNGAAYDFDPLTEEGTAPVVPDDDDDDPIPDPASVTIDNVTRTVTTFGDPPEDIRATVLKITIPAPPSKALVAEVEYQEVGDTEWTAVPLNNAQTIGYSGALQIGDTYVARARYRSLGRASSWVTSSSLVASQP